MMDHRQRLFSRSTITQKCSWLSNYAEFVVAKPAGPHFSQTFRLLSNPTPKPKSRSGQITLRRDSSLPMLQNWLIWNMKKFYEINTIINSMHGDNVIYPGEFKKFVIW